MIQLRIFYNNPEYTLLDIKSTDVVLIVLSDITYLDPVEKPENITYIGYIFRKLGICHMKGLHYTSIKRINQSSATWCFNNFGLVRFKTNLMQAIIAEYKNISNLYKITLYCIQTTQDLEEFIELFGVKNITFINEIKQLLPQR